MARRTRRKIKCDFCGKELERQPTLINKTNFCSKEHQNEFHRKRMAREGNPRWEGGISNEEYPIEWCVALKKKIRKRDKYACIKCGKKGLDVHHIDKDKTNNKEENLITLCHACHMKFHSGRRKNSKHTPNRWREIFWNWVGVHFEEVKTVQKEAEERPVYNIEVKKNNNYFANRILVHNCDETDEIDDESYTKVYRMLLESPDSTLVEIGNPWQLGHFYRHHHESEWEKIHIHWKDCVAAGRMTEADVRDQMREYTELETRVLLEAEFPSEAEYAIFPKEAIDNMVRPPREQPEKYALVLAGIDVARGGRDRTVITFVGVHNGQMHYLENVVLDTHDIMQIVGKYREASEPFGGRRVRLTVDTVGNGAGVKDRLAELGYDAHEFVGGAKAYNEERFANKKTEAAFRMAEEAKAAKIWGVPRASRYVLECRSWIYEVRSDRQQKLLDPEDKSPDFGDSLLYACNAQLFPEGGRAASYERIYQRTASQQRLRDSMHGRRQWGKAKR